MNLNWPKLVSQGRAKDIGKPWDEAELHAVFQLKIPADFVRAGVLTLEAYEEAKKNGLTPVPHEATVTLEKADEPKGEGGPLPSPYAPKKVKKDKK